MAKLKFLEPDGMKLEYFNGMRSYKAALYAIDLCNKIIKANNDGDLVLHYEGNVTPQFELKFFPNGSFDGLYLKDSEHCWVSIVGDTRDPGMPILSEYNTIIGYDIGKIHCTKRDLKEYFKLWRIAKIQSIHSVTSLTK